MDYLAEQDEFRFRKLALPIERIEEQKISHMLMDRLAPKSAIDTNRKTVLIAYRLITAEDADIMIDALMRKDIAVRPVGIGGEWHLEITATVRGLPN